MEAYERNVLHTLDADEFITIEDAKSAAAALNEGIEKAKNDICVLVHQDVIFPAGWAIMLQDAIRGLDFGVCGVWGSRLYDGKLVGNVIAPVGGQWIVGELPESVQCIDECIMIIRKSPGLRFDEAINHFHWYGPDICMESLSRGMKNYVIDAPVEHLSMGNKNDDFRRCKKLFVGKWENRIHEPTVVYTSCETIIVKPKRVKKCTNP